MHTCYISGVLCYNMIIAKFLLFPNNIASSCDKLLSLSVQTISTLTRGHTRLLLLDCFKRGIVGKVLPWGSRKVEKVSARIQPLTRYTISYVTAGTKKKERYPVLSRGVSLKMPWNKNQEKCRDYPSKPNCSGVTGQFLLWCHTYSKKKPALIQCRVTL